MGKNVISTSYSSTILKVSSEVFVVSGQLFYKPKTSALLRLDLAQLLFLLQLGGSSRAQEWACKSAQGDASLSPFCCHRSSLSTFPPRSRWGVPQDRMGVGGCQWLWGESDGWRQREVGDTAEGGVCSEGRRCKELVWPLGEEVGRQRVLWGALTRMGLLERGDKSLRESICGVGPVNFFIRIFKFSLPRSCFRTFYLFLLFYRCAVFSNSHNSSCALYIYM